MSKTIVFLFSFIFFSTRLLSQNYEVGLTTRRDWIAALKERQARSYWFVVTGQRDDCLTNQVGLAAIRGSCHSRQRRLQLVGQVDRRLPHALYYAIHVALGGAGFQSARMANTSLLIPVARHYDHAHEHQRPDLPRPPVPRGGECLRFSWIRREGNPARPPREVRPVDDPRRPCGSW